MEQNKYDKLDLAAMLEGAAAIANVVGAQLDHNSPGTIAADPVLYSALFGLSRYLDFIAGAVDEAMCPEH